jgi:catechol 2,3-dioxygenase-like lactoylglutathione lyase family enzyme
MKVTQFRIARPTHQLKEVVHFYNQVLGLKIIGSFENHEGYDGVMLGLPELTYHLEITQQKDAAPIPRPTKEHLLVFYFDEINEYTQANNHIQSYGVLPVEPENPYWIGKSETYEDPDGYRIVLFNGTFNV